MHSKNLSTLDIQYQKNDSIYCKYYSDFLKYKTNKVLSANKFLKLNKIYLYQGPDKVLFAFFLMMEENSCPELTKQILQF